MVGRRAAKQMDEVSREIMLSWVMRVVKIYLVVLSPSWFMCVRRPPGQTGVLSKYHRTKGMYLHPRCGVRWAGVSIPGMNYDSRKAAHDVNWCKTTSDGNR